jgi:hypothetical protein
MDDVGSSLRGTVRAGSTTSKEIPQVRGTCSPLVPVVHITRNFAANQPEPVPAALCMAVTIPQRGLTPRPFPTAFTTNGRASIDESSGLFSMQATMSRCTLCAAMLTFVC